MKGKLLLVLIINIIISTLAWANEDNQYRTVTGIVTDADTGEPIVGAAVMIQYSRTGSVTNLDGVYSIKLTNETQNLEVRFIGYKTRVVTVEEGVTVLDIELENDGMELQEVVVAGKSAVKNLPRMEKKGSTWRRSGMADNSIRLEVGDGKDDYLEPEAVQMAVRVDGFRVRILMDCFFYNDKQDGLEGTFKLKLPAGASPYYFAFGETEYLNTDSLPYIDYHKNQFNIYPEEIKYTDGRKWTEVKEARIVSKHKAATAYEEIVGQRIDPALMEWEGADFFACRVFPLAMGQLHRIVVGYDLNMTEGLGSREYILGLPTNAKDLRVDVKMASLPDMVPLVDPIIAKKFGPDYVSFSLHNPVVKDYYISYNTVSPVLIHDKKSNSFAAAYRMELPQTGQEYITEDAVFMLDASLSSQPDKFNIWLKIISEVLGRNEDTIRRFAVLGFNIDTYWWKSKYVDNTAKNREAFFNYAYSLALEGATDMGAALREAMNPSWQKNKLPKHIFLMSDADFNWGESNRFALLQGKNPGDRIHTYKTGLPGTNTDVLDYLSRETNGYSFTITGEEEAALSAAAFRYRPWTIEKIDVPGVKDFLISGQPTQLYNGQKLIFGGRGVPSGPITMVLNNGSETMEVAFQSDNRIESPLATRVYGQLAFARLENCGAPIEEAMEAYAVHYRIPGVDYSFLMLDNEDDYYYLAMSEAEAETYTANHTVESIVQELEKKGFVLPKRNERTNFMEWLNRIKEDETMEFDPDDAFMTYINQLSDEAFEVKRKAYKYRVRKKSEQTAEEKRMLSNEDVRFDDLLPQAESRRSKKNKETALKLLSSVIEKNPSDYIALRDIAIRAIEWGMGDMAYDMMKRVIINRQHEAIAYLTAAEALAESGNVDMAMIYYYICMNAEWSDDYGSFKEIAALKAMRYLAEIKQKTGKGWKRLKLSDNSQQFLTYFNQQIFEYLDSEDLLITDADVVVIINWNTNFTDVDLHVLEPTGEVCFYGNSTTKIGGQLTIDVVEGYGPEMYVLKNAVPGNYRIYVDYYSDSETRTSTISKVYADIYLGWGYKKEQHIERTILLEKQEDQVEVLQLTIK